MIYRSLQETLPARPVELELGRHSKLLFANE